MIRSSSLTNTRKGQVSDNIISTFIHFLLEKRVRGRSEPADILIEW